VEGSCEGSTEPSGFIKCREFLDCLKTSYMLKNSAPLNQLVENGANVTAV